MILHEARPVPEQKRKRSRKARVVLVIFFVGVAVAVFLTSPLSKVRSVEVVGNSQIPADQIRNASGVREGMNFWGVKPSAVDKQLRSQFPLIAKADVEVRFPGNVVIAVAEKPVAAILYQQATYYRLLSDGTVYDAAKELPNGTLPLLISEKPLQIEPGKPVPDPDVQAFCQQIVKIDRSRLTQISNFVIKQGNLWSAWTNPPQQFEIRFPPGDISTTLDVYMKFWKQQLRNVTSGTIYIYGPDEAWYDPSSAKPKKE